MSMILEQKVMIQSNWLYRLMWLGMIHSACMCIVPLQVCLVKLSL